ncbi:uncharacterized protein Obp50b [Drosophila kikkawai]|uniref:Uncharacterized protein Obp50b n=1 Tax=Drosophila kikkawai TaxID=30033 RepID=A0A6P4IEY2_DROKI|nr:uncharacterized protein LOC108074662 [Drosophila kikkawai]
MYLIGLSFVALLWLPSIVCENTTTTTMPDKECRKMLDLERLTYCCGVSLVDKFLFVGSNCTDYWNNFGACRYECLYNHWKLFDENNKIKKPELYTMITNLYNPLNGFHRYGTAFKEANEDCEELGNKYTDFVMRYANETQTELGLDIECRPDAMLHTQCIMAHVAYNCPTEFWRKAKTCDDLDHIIPECLGELLHSHVFVDGENAIHRRINYKSNGTSKRMPLGGYLFMLSSLLSLVLSNWLFTTLVVD